MRLPLRGSRANTGAQRRPAVPPAARRQEGARSRPARGAAARSAASLHRSHLLEHGVLGRHWRAVDGDGEGRRAQPTPRRCSGRRAVGRPAAASAALSFLSARYLLSAAFPSASAPAGRFFFSLSSFHEPIVCTNPLFPATAPPPRPPLVPGKTWLRTRHGACARAAARVIGRRSPPPWGT